MCQATNNSKEILFVSRPIAPPWDEASKNFAYNLAKEIADNNSNLEIHLMTKGILPDLPKNIIQHPIYTSSQNDFSLSQKLRMLWFLIWNTRKFNVTHLLFTPTKFNSLILKSIFRTFARQTKIIQTIATLREDLFSDNEIRKIMFGDKIVTYSEYAKNKLQSLGFDNIEKIYPGIDLDEYSPKNLSSVISEDKTSFIINFTGEYVRLGAMDDVINAFITVSKKIPKAKLSLAVRVKNEKDAKKKKEVVAKLHKNNLLKKVSFHDDGNYKMSDIYNLCDISLFPVRDMKGKFDVPLAVIEAMACEKPIILSNISILKEFANEKNSLTIEAGNVKQLIEAILFLYDNKHKSTHLGIYARIYVKENFSIEKTKKEYLKIYNSL